MTAVEQGRAPESVEHAECPCGRPVLLVKAGTVIRISVRGGRRVEVSVEPDRLEQVVAMCPSCGAWRGHRGRSWSPRVDGVDGEPGLAGLEEVRGRAYGLIEMRVGVALAWTQRAPAGRARVRPACRCGNHEGTAVFYGDVFLQFEKGDLTGQCFVSSGGAPDSSRWECIAGQGACSSSGPIPAGGLADAIAEAAAALAGMPDITVGAAVPSGQARSGWPARAVRVRFGRAPAVPEGSGRFLDWLEAGGGGPLTVPYIEEGFHPELLAAMYPAHVIRPRYGCRRTRCGGPHDGLWLQTGLPAAAAAMWAREGFAPCCARRFSDAGLHPRLAEQWMTAGFGDADEAAAWRAAGFAPVEARAWTNAGVGAPGAARGLCDAGLGPAEALEWSWLWGGRRRRSHRPVRGPSPQPAHASEALAWRQAGLSGAEARLWKAAGFTPGEAVGLPPGHPGRPDLDTLRALAALRR